MKWLSLLAIFAVSSLVRSVPRPKECQSSQSECAGCWGAVTRLSVPLGQHSSSFPTPRSGLGNLACELYITGLASEPTIHGLGAFLSSVEEKCVDECIPCYSPGSDPCEWIRNLDRIQI